MRTERRSESTGLVRIASMGYAVPGAVLATGLLPIIAGLDAAIDVASGRLFGVSTGLLLLGSGTAIVCNYVVRCISTAKPCAEPYEEAAVAALLIVLAGLVPVLTLARVERSAG